MIRWLLKTSSLTVLLALSTASYAQEKLTILWAQWDPANYLQELVKDYQKETGVEVVVETTPWADFQTKAFTEWNAHGDAYDMVVGDGAGFAAFAVWGLGIGPHGPDFMGVGDPSGCFRRGRPGAGVAPGQAIGVGRSPVSCSEITRPLFPPADRGGTGRWASSFGRSKPGRPAPPPPPGQT